MSLLAECLVLTDSGTGYPDLRSTSERSWCDDLFDLFSPTVQLLPALVVGTFFDLPPKLSNIKQALIVLVSPSFDIQFLTK
jgi:hypothetical protein